MRIHTLGPTHDYYEDLQLVQHNKRLTIKSQIQLLTKEPSVLGRAHKTPPKTEFYCLGVIV